MSHNIYVASSWRNEYQSVVVADLKNAGFNVYDFKDNDSMFHWREVDEMWKFWDFKTCQRAMDHALARKAFKTDMDALKCATALVLVMPCGRSSHIELGWAVGKGIPTAILHDRLAPVDPELMQNVADFQSVHLSSIISFLKDHNE